MSADIILYRLSDAQVQQKGLYFIPVKEWDNIPHDEYDVLADNADKERFEDGEPHAIIDITRYKWLYGNRRGWHRVREKLEQFPIRSGRIDAEKTIHRYFVADQVFWYSSYHVLKAKYYKKSVWLAVCTTKEDVVRFFNQYGNKRYPDAKELVEDVLRRWDDKSFLIISW